jgi:hypothetical protein
MRSYLNRIVRMFFVLMLEYRFEWMNKLNGKSSFPFNFEYLNLDTTFPLL